MFKWLNSEQKTSSISVEHLKLKCLLKKPSQDDIIEAKEFYIQLFFFKDIKGSKCCVLKSVSIKHSECKLLLPTGCF